jgi:hypothetical protein
LRIFSLTVHGIEFYNRSFGEFDDSAEIMRIQDSLPVMAAIWEPCSRQGLALQVMKVEVVGQLRLGECFAPGSAEAVLGLRLATSVG